MRLFIVIFIFSCNLVFSQSNTFTVQNTYSDSIPRGYYLFAINDSGLRILSKPKVSEYYFQFDTVEHYYFAFEIEKENQNWKITNFYLKMYCVNDKVYTYQEISNLPKRLRKYFSRVKFIVNGFSGEIITIGKTIKK